MVKKAPYPISFGFPFMKIDTQVLPSDPNLGILSDLEKGWIVTSIWVINPGHEWKKLVYMYMYIYIHKQKYVYIDYWYIDNFVYIYIPWKSSRPNKELFPFGWSMDSGFPILPMGTVWSAWTSWVYIMYLWIHILMAGEPTPPLTYPPPRNKALLRAY